MTDLKFEILNLLYNSKPLREQKFGNISKSVSADPTLIKYALSELSSKGIIENLPCSDVYILTDSGAELFEQVQDERDNASKQESQQSFDKKMSIANLLVPFVTFILGLLADHYTNLVSFVLALFK